MSRKLGSDHRGSGEHLDDSHPDGLRSSNQTTQLFQPHGSWVSVWDA
jgi:hypothetical protein